MVTKKDFILLADMIRDFNAEAETVGQRRFDKRQLELLAAFCHQANSAFKMGRWLAYIAGECGPNGGQRK